MLNQPPAAPPVVPEELEPIHPYILEALQQARGGDWDAFQWLRWDCALWDVIGPDAQTALVYEIYKPARKPRKRTTNVHTQGKKPRKKLSARRNLRELQTVLHGSKCQAKVLLNSL